MPTVDAPSEAEMMCAAICQKGIAGTVVSNDIDSILFGSPHVTRSLQLSKRQMECVTLDGIQEVIDLELEEMRDLAIVCGCDFHKKGIPGIGPRKGILLLRRYGGLEGLLKAKGYNSTDRTSVLEARAIFDESNYLDLSGITSTLQPPITSRIKRLLSPILGSERSESTIDTFVGLWKKFFIVQDTLETWF